MEANRCCLFIIITTFFFRLGIKHLLLKGKMSSICLKNTPRKQSKEVQGMHALGRVLSNISAWPSHFLEEGCGWCLTLCLQAQQACDLAVCHSHHLVL